MNEILKACKNCGCESIEPMSPHKPLFYKYALFGDISFTPNVRADRWFYCIKCNKCCYL